MKRHFTCFFLSLALITTVLAQNSVTSVQDACNSVTFRKTYTIQYPNWNFSPWGRFHDYISTSDGGYLFSGFLRTSPSPSYEGLIVKTDFKGNIIWQKKISSADNDDFKIVKETPGGNYIAGGYSQNNIVILGMNPDGEILWSKKYPAGNSSYLYDLIITEDNGILAAGYTYPANGSQAALLLKLDLSGNVLWSKMYDNHEGDYAHLLAESADGYLVESYSQNAPDDITIMKVNKQNGNIFWNKQFDFTGQKDILGGIQKSHSGFHLNVDSRINNTTYNTKQVIATLEAATGTITWSRQLQSVYGVLPSASSPAADKGFICLQTPVEGTSRELFIYKLDEKGIVQWGKKQVLPGSINGGYLKIYQQQDGGYTIAGNGQPAANTTPYLHLLKTDEAGNTYECLQTDAGVTTGDIAVSSNNFTWSKIEDVALSPQPFNVSVASESLLVNTLCAGNTCTSLKISGNNVACNLTDTITFIARKDADCFIPVQWQADENFVQLISSTDSSIAVRFRKSGTTKLLSEITTGCNAIKDSINIRIYNMDGPGILGNDTSLCTNSPVTLSTTSVFDYYRWFDNSTRSSVTVYKPGAYWVEVTNADRCTARDSIIVNEKDCGKTIYIPNAFTPNNDHTNNTFKPVMSALPESYYFAVFNRLGEKIFETTDPGKGWDGVHKAKIQPAGSFIWFCRYKFTGENQKVQLSRGIVTLIR